MNCKITEIYPWLYSIQDPLDVFCYLIVGDNKALLFDTGHGVLNLPETIKAITPKPLTVILGHGHIDHACGAYQFGEVYLHEADFQLCREHTSPPYRRNILNEFEENGIELPEGFNIEAFKTAGTGNLIKLDVSKEIELGGLTLEIVEMPGHTAGSIGMLIKEKRTLLTSDSANDHLWLFLNESLTIKEYIETLERSVQLDFKVFFTGHSDKPKPKSDFKKYIQVAKNAAISKASPYNLFEDLKPLIYKEDGVAIIFNARTLDKD